MNSKPLSFELSDEEKVVRTYECTKLRKLFAPITIGYLTVTTKRVVYHALGKNLGGFSQVLAELPLEDISGLSSSVSVSINFLNYALTMVILYFATMFLTNILPNWMTSIVVSIVFTLPFLIFLLFDRNILDKEIQARFLEWLGKLPLGEQLKKRDSIYYNGLFTIFFDIGLVFLGWRIAHSPELYYSARIVSFVILGAVFFYIALSILGRARTFSLRLGSKSGKGSGIFIPGNAFSLILPGDMTASQTLTAGPAKDAELVVKELGAVLTDIRQLGELGIKKWTETF